MCSFSVGPNDTSLLITTRRYHAGLPGDVSKHIFPFAYVSPSTIYNALVQLIDAIPVLLQIILPTKTPHLPIQFFALARAG